jgi:microcystin-dependent protein
MSNKRISELDDGGNLQTTDISPIGRNNRTYKVKIGEYMVPAGTVVAFAGNNIPNGWLKCNGDTIPNGNGTVQGKSGNFSALHSQVGGTLPDLRGYFIRGLDDGKGIDVNRALRSTQEDSFKNHNHSYVLPDNSNGAGGGDAYASIYAKNNPDYQRSTRNTGDSETRPKNVALHYIIKY